MAKTKYSTALAQIVYNLTVQGCTDKEICKAVGIDKATFYRWKSSKSDFCDNIKKAEEERMRFLGKEAEKSLLKLIQGYTVKETMVETIPSNKFDDFGNPVPTIKCQRTVNKHIQPNITAIIFALTNSDPAHWKNRQNMDVTQKDTTPQLVMNVPDIETAQTLQRLAKRQAKFFVKKK